MANVEQLIKQAAAKYGINPRILRQQLVQESGLRTNARSGAGAEGIAQFIPSTAKAYGVNAADNNPADDIMGAAHYDSDLLKKYGTYERALSAYNSGQPDAYKDPGFAGGQTYNYVKDILGAGGGGSSPRSTPAAVASTPSSSGSTADYQAERNQAVLAWYQNRMMPGATAQLASALTTAKNEAGSNTGTVAATSPVSSSVSGGGNVSGHGGTALDPSGKKVANWIEPILDYARQRGWKGTIESGYRSDQQQTQIYNSGVRPAALPRSMGGGGSNHEFTMYPGGAVDVTDAETLAKILENSPYKQKLVYAGSKDPVHFSHPHNGSY